MKKTEDIGARRLHTVIEKLLKIYLLMQMRKKGSKVVVTSQLVSEKLEKIVDNVDVTRYIL